MRPSPRGCHRLSLPLLPVLALAGGVGALEPPPPSPGLAAWGYEAHRIICEIAWREMALPTRDRIRELLALDPEYGRFTDACVWADEVRSRIRAGVPGYRHLSRYTPSHYVNLPPGSPTAAGQPCTAVRRGEPEPCILDAIREFSDRLRHATAPEERLEALKFLAHLVGDIHQPLHVAWASDRGGNEVTVQVMGQGTWNLHAVWDRFFTDHADRSWPEWAVDLQGRIRPSDREAWSAELDPVAWADETFRITESRVYAELERGDGYVGQDFFDRNIGLVEDRFARAGVRLAALLDSLMTSGSSN